MNWKTIVRETRNNLGLTRQEFADLLGVNLRTLHSWEFEGTVPAPLYQNLVVNIHNNKEQARKLIEQQKNIYFENKIEETNRAHIFNNDVRKKVLIIGGLLLLAHILSKDDEKKH